MKLQSMTDFVLDQSEKYTKGKYLHAANWALEFEKYAKTVIKYAEFLKQPLTLGIFIPCDLEGNVLEEPLHYRSFIDYENDMDDDLPIDVLNICGEYHEAKKRILFEGFSFKSKDNFKEWCEDNNVTNVESMVGLCFTLTPNAIKQLGL